VASRPRVCFVITIATERLADILVGERAATFPRRLGDFEALCRELLATEAGPPDNRVREG
jgi:hypothetical protein